MAEIPLTPPWESPYTPISRSRIVVVANSSVAWSTTLCEEYCDARGIPRSNIIPFALGANLQEWFPSPVTMAFINSSFVAPLKAFCLARNAQAILLGPACPILIRAPKSDGGTASPPLTHLASMCMGFPPVPLNDLSYTWAIGEAGDSGSWQQRKVVLPTNIQYTVDVTDVVDEIRQGAFFASGNRMNLWLSPASPLVSGSFNDYSGPTPPRLTVVQNGVTVYDQALTLATEDGLETVGSIWLTAGLFVVDRTGASTGDQPNDRVATLSFANVTVDPNPALAITSATLTLGSNHELILVSGDIRVYGESQESGVAVLWSNAHKPIGSAVPRVPSHGLFIVARDPAELGVNINDVLGQSGSSGYESDATPNFYSTSKPTGDGCVIRYDYPPLAGLSTNFAIFSPTPEATSFLGSAEFYDTSYEAKGRKSYPVVPVGRIGMQCAYSYNGGLPTPETEAIDRDIIARATQAFAEHDITAARQKPILFHAAIFPAGFTQMTMYIYSLCKSWGMNGALYAYAEGATTAYPGSYAESVAPPAGGLYTEANISALPYIQSDTVRQPFYMMLGNWLNLTPDDPYSAPYSTSWLPMTGAGAMTGPSQGWQYSMQALYGGGVTVMTDPYHISASHMAGHLSTFYNLLRGMSWLEAVFWSGAMARIVIGDPLWAPYGFEQAEEQEPIRPRNAFTSRRYRAPRYRSRLDGRR